MPFGIVHLEGLIKSIAFQAESRVWTLATSLFLVSCCVRPRYIFHGKMHGITTWKVTLKHSVTYMKL